MSRARLACRLSCLCVWLFVLFVAPSQAATWIELHPNGTPPAVDSINAFGQPAFYDSANNRLILFLDGNPAVSPKYSNRVYVLTNANGLGGTPAWVQLLPAGTPPNTNGLESVIYDEKNNRLIVYGGCWGNCSPPLSDVYALTHANGLGGDPEWVQVDVTNPQERMGHSAVYDPLNNLMIAFGGGMAFYGTDQNDTRVLSNANGLPSPSAWTTIEITGEIPPIREFHGAVYDTPNNRMMFFGGTNLIETCCPYIQQDYNDTWVLANANGEAGNPVWTQLHPTGTLPPARGEHSTVYDPMFNRLIVFGGLQWQQGTQKYKMLGDLWQLTNANGLAAATPIWTAIGQAGDWPGPRYGHAAAFDTANQRMIVMGGRDSKFAASNQVWVLALQSCNGKPATLVGTNGSDALTGTPGNDVIVGLAGNDSIGGGGGNDTICGGGGNDTLYGGGGDDWLSGDTGEDTLNGNGGGDTCSGETRLNCE